MAANNVARHSVEYLAVARDGFAVTASDSTDFTTNARYLYVGTGGNVVVVTTKGSVLTYKNVPSGGYIYMECKRVNSSNTTATDIVAGL